MTKSEYLSIFETALDVAAKNAESMLGFPIPKMYEIGFHGLAPSSRSLSKEAAFEALYLGPDRFFRIIDISVRRVSNQVCTVFLRVSSHPPGSFDQTWNQPAGSGPFKQVLASEIEVRQ